MVGDGQLLENSAAMWSPYGRQFPRSNQWEAVSCHVVTNERQAVATW